MGWPDAFAVVVFVVFVFTPGLVLAWGEARAEMDRAKRGEDEP